MTKPDKTIVVIDTPISGPEDRTVTSITISDDGKRLVIESSRALPCDEILHKLRSSWDMMTNRTRAL